MRTVHVFVDADLRCGHDGLIDIAQKNGVKLSSLKDQETVLFLNRSKNKVKAYCYNGVVSYYRSADPTRQITIEMLNAFVRAVTKDGTMNFTAPVKRNFSKLFTESAKLKGLAA